MSSWESTLLPGLEMLSGEAGTAAPRSATILVADDAPEMLEFLAEILVLGGDRVIRATDGFQAVDKFVLEQPDLVLMDVCMPGMDGFEATRRIKALSAGSKWVPVIMLTALDTQEDFDQGLQAGADDYLTKPFPPALLMTKLKFVKRVLAIQSNLYALKRFQTIFDHLIDGIVATNERGIIVSFNRAAEEIFGYRTEEVLGRNISMLMPIPESYRHDAYMARYTFSGQAKVMGQGRDIHGRRKDGSIVPLSVGLTEVEWAGARHFIGVVSDISERKRAERFEAELTAQLRSYREHNEEEKRVTREVLQRIVRADGLDDPLLQWQNRPAENFSGDVVAAHRAPDGRLVVFVADATGHGLSAAITLLPALGIFYAMTDKGFALTELVSEINARLHQTLPTGRFVAATLIAINEPNKQFEIWNGGMPASLLCCGPEEQHLYPPMHPALGILPPNAFDSTCDSGRWGQPAHLIAVSDGVIEAQNRAGTPLEMDGLRAAARSAGTQNPFPQLLDSLNEHLGSTIPHDDISLVVIRLE